MADPHSERNELYDNVSNLKDSEKRTVGIRDGSPFYATRNPYRHR